MRAQAQIVRGTSAHCAQLILPFDKDALPAYYDEEPDPDRDPLYPRQPLPTLRRPVVTVNIVNIRATIAPVALHAPPFVIDEVAGTIMKEV